MSTTEPELRDRPFGELVRELSDHTTRLVRAEVELAKLELAAKGKQAGIGAGLFGGAGVFVLAALGALTACVIAAIATALALWLAALVTGAGFLLIGGIVALMGKNRVQKGVPPVPEQALESTKTDVRFTKERVQEGRANGAAAHADGTHELEETAR